MTWIDWNAADLDLAAFTARLVAVRRAHRSLREDRFLTGGPLDASGVPDVAWLKPGGTMEPSDWADGRVVGVALYAAAGDGAAADRAVVWINGLSGDAEGWLPAARTGFAWRVEIDSSGRPPVVGDRVKLAARSVSVFAERAVDSA